MKLLIISIILVFSTMLNIPLNAQSKKTTKKRGDTAFRLKEPKIKKKSAFDLGRTAKYVAGTAVLGAVAYTQFKPEKKEEEKKQLPKPPAWPE